MSDEQKPPEKRRRRRRRRRPGGRSDGGATGAESTGAAAPQSGGGAAGDGATGGSSARPEKRRRRRRGRGERGERGERGGDRRGRDGGRERKQRRDERPGEEPRRPPRPSAPPPPADVDDGWDDESAVTSEPTAAEPYGDDDADTTPMPEERWGEDQDAPTPEVTLAPDLPADPADDDPDPATELLERDDERADDSGRRRAKPVANVVGIKFHPAGKIYEFDGSDDTYVRGEEVLVETEKGTRVGTVALASVRRPHSGGPLKRIVRRPDEADRSTDERNRERAREALGMAREVARQRRMDIKVYRADYTFGATKLLVHFSSEKRVDFRELARELNNRLRTRVEIRQTGVRDEAKMVGGIGSCGRELCCSTFLPGFAPVSIKMAKDQGMVLNPTKVSGQCGRLKCCLVYEQDMYAALRKGLPKLGKRVIAGERGEGRVVEVDVLRQRIRVSFGPGDFEVFGAGEVEPLFPSQPQGKPR